MIGEEWDPVSRPVPGVKQSAPDPDAYAEFTYEIDVPPGVLRYLQDQEVQHGVIAMHPHRMMLFRSSTAALTGLAAAITASVIAPSGVTRATWILWVALMAWYGIGNLRWYCTWYVFTPVRIMVISGVLARSVRPLPVKQTTDAELFYPMFGQYLGYATVCTQSRSTDHQLSELKFVPHPVQVFNYIWSNLAMSLRPPEGHALRRGK